MSLVVNNSCTGCGLCARICPSQKIKMIDGLAAIDDSCMMCGQCYSVCPTDSIRYEGLKEELPQVEAARTFKEFIQPKDMLTAMWSRRSVRFFTDDPVSDKDINFLLEAAHSAPTASNAQNVRIILLQDKRKDVTMEMTKALSNMGEELLEKGGLDSLTEYYAHKWAGMLLDYISNGKDALFFNAPLIAMFVSPHTVNATIAATHMNLMAESLSLGACFIAFANRAVDYDPSLKKVLGMGEGEKLVCTLAIGKPRVNFKRAPGRKPLDVTRL